MRHYQINIWCYAPYKKEPQEPYMEEASSLHTAVSRAIKRYKKEVLKKKRFPKKLHIEVIPI